MANVFFDFSGDESRRPHDAGDFHPQRLAESFGILHNAGNDALSHGFRRNLPLTFTMRTSRGSSGTN